MNVEDLKRIEKKWQEAWKRMKEFKFDPDSEKPVYSIDTPPRYASGVLHIGHATHYSHIDMVARYKRMRGYNVFFPLCYDVNGIPIEERVERALGITRLQIERQKFIRLCKEFADKNIEGMTRQYEALGIVMDPSIYYRTDDPEFRKYTQIAFIRLYKKGLIYRENFPINWCPRCLTALADAEIEYKEKESYLNYIRFEVKEGGEIIIATTRPELLGACQAVAINPADERAKDLRGKHAIVPIYGKEVPIILDEEVDMNFGSGIVMICTYGDKDDVKWVMKYKLPVEIVVDDVGKMNEKAGKYAGMKIEEAREEIVKDLERMGALVKREKIKHNVACCWRCGTPIEILPKEQWFLKIIPFKEELKRVAREAKWIPEFMIKRLDDWIDSLEWDWCLSRQRYYGTPIPVWICQKCGEVVLAREEDCYVDPTVDPPPVEKCPKCGGPLKGCEDVFDTWMDSSGTPLYNTWWKRDERLFKKLYPMDMRPNAHDIIRTWDFYSIVRGYLETGRCPFKEFMIDGFILAPDGRPMHAHLGNVIDPFEVLQEYGAEAFRYYAATCSLGEDNAFRWKDVKRGVRFAIKLLNIGKFVGEAIKGWRPKESVEEYNLHTLDRWILSKFSRLVKEVTEAMDNFRFDKNLKRTEVFAWNVFADEYIEAVKPRVYEERDEAALYTLYTVCLGVMKLLAPIIPHVTEEVYCSYFKEIEGEKSIHLSRWPEPVLEDKEAERKGEMLKEIIASIRRWKASKGISLKERISKVIIASDEEFSDEDLRDVKRAVNSKEISKVGAKRVRRKLVEIRPNYRKLGPEFKEKVKEIADQIRKGEIVEGKGIRVIIEGKEIWLGQEYYDPVYALYVEGEEIDELIELPDLRLSVGVKM